MGTEDPKINDPRGEAQNQEPKLVRELAAEKLKTVIDELSSQFDWLAELAVRESKDDTSIPPLAERLFRQLKQMTDEVAQEPIVDQSKITIRNKLLSKVRNAQRSITNSMSVYIEAWRKANKHRYLPGGRQLIDQDKISSMDSALQDKATKFQMRPDEVWRLRIDILVQLVLFRVILDLNLHHPVDIPMPSQNHNQEMVQMKLDRIRDEYILYLHQMVPMPTVVTVS